LTKIQILLKKTKRKFKKYGKKYENNLLPYALKTQLNQLAKGFRSIIDYAFSYKTNIIDYAAT